MSILPFSVRPSRTSIALVLFGMALLPRAAHAQEYTRRSYILPRGAFEITGEPARPRMLRLNLSENSVGKPIEIPAHLYWGVSENVTIGITHDRGICLSACNGKPYNDAGFGMLVWLSGGRDYEIDLHAGVPIHSFDPFFIGLKAGVLGRVNFSNVGFVFDPSVYIGMNKRNFGNGDGLSLPVWFYFQTTPVFVPFVGTGMIGPVDNFAGSFAIPIEGGMIFSASRDADLGFMFDFPNLLGHGGNSRGREAGFLGRFRF
jgi:hypothetical protein